MAGALVRAAADAIEDAIWSAQREAGRGYGIAVFDLEAPGGKTSITINYYHAPGADKAPNPAHEWFETVVLSKSGAVTAGADDGLRA